MKKLLLIMPLLMLGIHSINAMLKQSQSRYNPFDKLATLNNRPQLTEDQLLQVIKRGDYDAIEQELLRGLNAKYIFETGEFKGKSLIQVAFGHSISNRYEIASRLLKHDANPADLNEFIKIAVKAYNPEMVKWLLAHGAQDDSAYEVVDVLEKNAQGFKKEQLIKIKEYLSPQKTVVAPEITTTPKITEASKKELPVVSQSQLQRVKKDDVFTVLAQADEQKLFNALLSGKEDKVAEYLEMGVSPDFVFWKGASGKSLLKVAVTETLNNQEKVVDLLLRYGADSQALSDGLILAVERFDKPKVEWLLAKGAPITAQLKEKIKDLEKNNTHPVKQKKLAEIKMLLDKKHIPVPNPTVAPAVTQFNKPLPPIPGKKPVAAESTELVKNIYGNKK